LIGGRLTQRSFVVEDPNLHRGSSTARNERACLGSSYITLTQAGIDFKSPELVLLIFPWDVGYLHDTRQCQRISAPLRMYEDEGC